MFYTHTRTKKVIPLKRSIIFDATGSSAHRYLHRPALFSTLTQALHHPITTIIAGAGYGKTSLAMEFVRQSEHLTWWYQFSMLDTTVFRFWEQFKQMLGAANEGLASKIKKWPFPQHEMQGYLFLEQWMDCLEEGKHYFLVFDDCHLIQEPQLWWFLELLVRAEVPQLSLLLISRTAPDINLCSLRLTGRVLSITERDLSFDEEEIAAYFHTYGCYPSANMISEIHQQTNGWIFSIDLIRLSLEQQPDDEINAITAMKKNVFHQIEREIYAPLSEEAKRFLVSLSLLERLPADLVHSLAMDRGDLIAMLHQINSFMRHDICSDQYDIHHLLLDFLRAQHPMLSDEQKRSVYLEAASWYSTHGYQMEAIDCYKQAKEYKTMLQLMNHFSTVPTQEVASYLIHLIDSIDDLGEERYLGMVIKARYFGIVGDREEILSRYQTLLTLFEKLPDSSEKSYYICAMNICLGIYNMITVGRDFVKPLRAAYDTGVKGFAKAVYRVGNYAFPLTTSFTAYMEQVDSIIDCVTDVLHGCGSGFHHLCKGEYAFFRRDISHATAYCLQAQAEAKKHHQYYIEDLSLFYLFRLKLMQGNWHELQHLLEQLKQQTKQHEYPDYFTMFEIAAGWYYVAVGDLDRSVIWNYHGTIEPTEMMSANSCGLLQLLVAKCYLADQRFSEGLAFLKSLDSEQVVERYSLGRLEVLCLQAATLYRLKETEQALQTLQEAYAWSAADGFTMPFIELGNHMVGLMKLALQHQKQNGSLDIPETWMSNIQRKASAYAKKTAFLSAEYAKRNQAVPSHLQKLTKKEQRCLMELCRGLSRAEIAADQNLSENYIKLMIQQIYTKIGATNKEEAIRIASLYLFPD